MAMPIYEYEHDSGDVKCPSPRFEVVQPMSEAPLEVCPTCGKACHRVFSSFGVSAHGVKGLLSKSNLEAHGFTQYTRHGKGYYEKTAGMGPGALASGD
jgi:putative FmdB family regulatory protein